MKKNLLLAGLLAFIVSALSSCGSDETAAFTGEANAVSFTLKPEGMMHTRVATRTTEEEEMAEAGYLRFKLSVYNTDTGEKIEGADAVQLFSAFDFDYTPVSFTVNLPKGTAYTCVFWLDRVAEQADKDLYYNTADPTNITLTDAAVQQDANTERLSAALGTATIAADGRASGSNVVLKPVVAELNIKTTSNMEGVEKLSVACGNIATGINALTGEVTQSVTSATYLLMSAGVGTPDSPFLQATFYLLAPTEGMTLNAVTIGMIDAGGDVVRSVEVPNVPLKRKYRTNIIGDFGIMQSNTFSVSIDGEFDGESNIDMDKELRVGTFYYSDGTWSNKLDADKTPVGIVFYVGRYPNDTDTYKENSSNKEITDFHGYVVALRDASTETFEWGPTVSGLGLTDCAINFGSYHNFQAMQEAAEGNLTLYPACNACTRYGVPPAGGSRWLLPSYLQLQAAVTSPEVAAALAACRGEAFAGDYWTCYEIDNDRGIMCSKSGTPISAQKSTAHSVRGVLVF